MFAKLQTSSLRIASLSPIRHLLVLVSCRNLHRRSWQTDLQRCHQNLSQRQSPPNGKIPSSFSLLPHHRCFASATSNLSSIPAFSFLQTILRSAVRPPQIYSTSPAHFSPWTLPAARIDLSLSIHQNNSSQTTGIVWLQSLQLDRYGSSVGISGESLRSFSGMCKAFMLESGAGRCQARSKDGAAG